MCQPILGLDIIPHFFVSDDTKIHQSRYDFAFPEAMGHSYHLVRDKPLNETFIQGETHEENLVVAFGPGHPTGG